MKRLLARWLLSASFFFLIIPAWADRAVLKLSVVDRATGEPVAARAHVRDSQGNFVIPDDAIMFGGDCDMSDAGAGFTDLTAALNGFTQSLTNPYTATQQFYLDGKATLVVPPGPVEVVVFKGTEYQRGTLQLDISANAELEREIQLDRWINMPAQGWYSADDHIHIQRPHPDLNAKIMQQMRAEDVHVANLLQMGKVLNFKIAPQYEFGRGGHYQEGHYILAAGQENPRSHYLGHTITLGAAEPVFNADRYLIYREVWERTIDLGGINGFAHAMATSGGLSPYRGGALLLPHDLMHFLEVLQFNRGGYQVWYDVLNLGYRIAGTAGTDYPCADQTIPGHERFYTKVEGDLTYAKWLDAVKGGRTFVTTGPILEFKIDDSEIGDEVVLRKPGKVRIRGQVRFNPISDSFGDLELVQNGELITQIPNVDGQDRMELDIELYVDRDSWFALRAVGSERSFSGFASPFHFSQLGATSHAHTSPIYVTIKNGPSIADSAEAKAVAQSFLARLASLEDTLKESNIQTLGPLLEVPDFDGVPTETLVKNREALLNEIAVARAHFAKRAR
ncbi:MAG: CehA/McbA family metallohydrolase [Pseudomonadales bacterium]